MASWQAPGISKSVSHVGDMAARGENKTSKSESGEERNGSAHR